MRLNAKQVDWSQSYQAALSKYLAQGQGGILTSALRLGCDAVPLKLETLDVARVHERALLALSARSDSAGIKQREVELAKFFFTETIVPIEKTHLAALKNDARVDQLTRALQQRTEESIASIRLLHQGIVHRQAAEAALKRSGKQLARLLRRSHQLRRRLRNKMRAKLVKQEGNRKKTSRRLQDEIIQTLVTIKLRLLALNMLAKTNSESLKKEIAETRRLVKQSMRTIQRLAHEIDVHHEA